MAKLHKKIIAALDIGTSKIVCFIGEISSNNELKIIGIGHQISRGIKAGIITDIKLAEESFRSAIAAAEQMANCTLEQIYISVPITMDNSHRLTLELPLSGQELRSRDVQRVNELAAERIQKTGQEVLHSFALEYTLDNVTGIKSPEGMCGHHLIASMHLLTISETHIQNLSNCLAKCHLDIEQCIANALCSGLATLEEDEKDLGTLVLDIGGGQVISGGFKHGTLIFADSLSLGGNHLTSDLAQGLSTSISAAERVKILYGSIYAGARDEQEQIEVPLCGDENEAETRNVKRILLSQILRPRAEEILELTRERLEKSGLANSFSKIVLTGGSATLPGLKELCSEIFAKQTRVGTPKAIEGMAESTKGPAFSNATGLLMAARKEFENSSAAGIYSFSNIAKKVSAFFNLQQ